MLLFVHYSFMQHHFSYVKALSVSGFITMSIRSKETISLLYPSASTIRVHTRIVPFKITDERNPLSLPLQSLQFCFHPQVTFNFIYYMSSSLHISSPAYPDVVAAGPKAEKSKIGSPRGRACRIMSTYRSRGGWPAGCRSSNYDLLQRYNRADQSSTPHTG